MNAMGYTLLKTNIKKDKNFEYGDAHNYYDIDVDKMLLFKQSDNEYFIRYSDLNKMEIESLQLKIKDFSVELHTFRKSDSVMFIHNDDKDVFKKLEKHGIRLLN